MKFCFLFRCNWYSEKDSWNLTTWFVTLKWGWKIVIPWENAYAWVGVVSVLASCVESRAAHAQCVSLLLLRKLKPLIWLAWPGPLACNLSFHWHHYLPWTQGHLLHQPKGAALSLGNHCRAYNPVFPTYSVAGWGHTLHLNGLCSFFFCLCSSRSTVSCALAVGCHQLKYGFDGTQTSWEMKFLGARCSHYCWVGHCFQACSVNSVCVCTYTNTHTYFKTKIRTIGCWLNLLDLTSISPFSHNEKPHSPWLLEWDNHLLYPTYRHNDNASTISCFLWFCPEVIYH